MADKKELPLALLEVLKKNTDEDHVLSTKNLTSILESEYDLTLERRTLYANVELLKQYGHKISTWQENGKGYYLEEHQFTKPEVFLLCNAVHSSNFISAKESKQIIDKLLATLSTAQSHEYTDRVYMPKTGKSSHNLLLENIAVISSAIEKRRPIRFTYLHYNEQKKLVARREKPYEVEPRFIVYRDSRAYLISTSDHHEGFAHYRIDRMTNIGIVEDRKVPSLSNDLDAYEYARNMYYMFNDEPVNAVIRCEKRVLDHVIDTFGTDCRILPEDENHFTLHVKGSSSGLLLFAQQYLDAAEIVEPAELRQQMTQILSDSLKRYKK